MSGMELTHYTLEQMNAAGAYPVAHGVMAILAVVANCNLYLSYH